MLAYYNISAWVSLVIERIVYGIEDKVIFYVQNNETNEKIGRKRRATVRYTAKGHAYFMHNRTRVYLDDCMRVS